jgi:hypothetical protein
MKATFTAAILFAAALGASAQTMNLKADIPFDFVVGSRTMPAGMYDVKHTGGVLILHRAGEVRTSVVAVAQQASRPAAERPATLIFNRYGDDYFLSRVWPASGNTGPALMRSRREKEVVARGGTVQTAGVRLQPR